MNHYLYIFLLLDSNISSTGIDNYFFDIDQMTVISLISLMSQIPLGYHISETEQVRHIVTINVR